MSQQHCAHDGRMIALSQLFDAYSRAVLAADGPQSFLRAARDAVLGIVHDEAVPVFVPEGAYFDDVCDEGIVPVAAVLARAAEDPRLATAVSACDPVDLDAVYMPRYVQTGPQDCWKLAA